MASAFKTATAADVGTSLTTVYTCPSSTTSTIIGLYLCNQSGGQIEATAQFYDAGETNHISMVHGHALNSKSSSADRQRSK